jgi:phosphohistidine phosphatase
VRLYLAQHGRAKTEDEDPDRSLTDDGIDDVSRVARQAIDSLGVHADRIVHSGKTRARQTAEIWARLLDVDFEQADALAPNDDPSTWAERIQADTHDVLIVGHLPHLERLAALLVTGDANRSVIAFRPGGLARLERGDNGWIVSIVLPPDDG